MKNIPENGAGSNTKVSMLPIFFIVLVDVFGMTLVLPLLAIYAETFGASPVQATMLLSIYAACQLFSSPILGHFSDRTGRKPMLVISQIGTFLGFLILAQASSLSMIYLSRVIDGITAGNISLAQAYISDNTDVKNRTKSFGLIGIAFGLGYFIGPSLSGFMAGRYGIASPIYLAAGMSALSVILTTFLLKGERKADAGRGRFSMLSALTHGFSLKTYAIYLKKPVLGDLLVQFMCHMVAFSIFTSGFALFAERRFTWNGKPFGPREIGYFMGIVGFVSMSIQGGLIGRLSARFGDRNLVKIGFFALGAAYLILGLTSQMALLLLVAVGSAVGTGLLRPTLMSLVTQNAEKTEQGTVTGLAQSLTSLSSIICPIIGGLFIEHGFLSPWAFSASVAALVGLALALRARRPAAG